MEIRPVCSPFLVYIRENSLLDSGIKPSCHRVMVFQGRIVLHIGYLDVNYLHTHTHTHTYIYSCVIILDSRAPIILTSTTVCACSLRTVSLHPSVWNGECPFAQQLACVCGGGGFNSCQFVPVFHSGLITFLLTNACLLRRPPFDHNINICKAPSGQLASNYWGNCSKFTPTNRC